MESERRCDYLLQQAQIAEEKEQHALIELEKAKVVEDVLSDGESDESQTMLLNKELKGKA
jgi:hypothetical protein